MQVNEFVDEQNVKSLEICFTQKDIQQVLVHLVVGLQHLEKSKVLKFGLQQLKEELRIEEHRDPNQLEKIYKLDNQKLIDIFKTYILKNNISFKELYKRCEYSIDVNEEWIRHDEEGMESRMSKLITRKERMIIAQRKENLQKDKKVLYIFEKLKSLKNDFEIDSIKIV